MKKLLIGTSALVAAVAFAGSANAADPIKLSIGGYGAVVVGFVDQDIQDNGSAEFNSVDVQGDNEIHFKGKTTLDNGLTVSVKYEFEAGGRSMSDVSDEWNISVAGSFGTIVMGADDNALVAIAMGAPRVGGRLFNGGVDEGDLISGGYVVNPGVDVVNATFVNTNSDDESISYISPSFAGFTVGATYVSSVAGSGGDRGGQWATTAPGGKGAADAYGVGAMYNGEFGGVGVGLEGGYLTGDTATEEHNEWQVGAKLSYAGFGIGGAYRNIDLGTDNDRFAWELGVGYTVDAYGVSLTYFDSTVEQAGADDEAQVWELAGQYTMGPGVMLVGGVGYVNFDGAGTGNDNDGVVVATGLSLAF